MFRIKAADHGLRIDSDNSYIIVANHQSRFDPWLILAALRFREFWALMPIRFMTAEKYMESWLPFVVLSLFGCVSTKQNGEKTVLWRFINLLESGQTAFIFPTGRVGESKGNPKVGAIYLERAVSNAYLIPISVQLSGQLGFWQVILRRVSVNVVIGEPYRHEGFGNDLLPLAKEVMGRIMAVQP